MKNKTPNVLLFKFETNSNILPLNFLDFNFLSFFSCSIIHSKKEKCQIIFGFWVRDIRAILKIKLYLMKTEIYEIGLLKMARNT
ncbi:hypothetical protein BpHYR1_006834 [Brachionus plicatilis]|uniref:Uncharacterized protein n=1 Tax=Brachionus plicatilis TaxID=10195 RepID=A0A3M7PIM3_BRAPC|nr:hypothetical protein BpHYR1_006834 [Brachionus plicatilis]